MAIGKDDIFRVADELDAQGLNPTLAAVRKSLGGGSFTTISEAMTEWKAKKAAKETPLKEPAPQSIQDQMAELATEVWAMALSLANGRLSSERQALEEARLQLEAERKEAAELADQVSADLEESRVKVVALEREHATTQAALVKVQSELVAVSERATTAEARATEITRRADDLNAELARVNGQNADLIRALTEKVMAKDVGASGAGGQTDGVK
jgi:chromosome segregation ATPase